MLRGGLLSEGVGCGGVVHSFAWFEAASVVSGFFEEAHLADVGRF